EEDRVGRDELEVGERHAGDHGRIIVTEARRLAGCGLGEPLLPSRAPMPATAPPVLVLAGTASSVGKTTVALGLIEALRARGLVVQPFKVGPDFIDAGLHTVAAGRPSYSLDGWMCGREQVIGTVASRGAGAGLRLVEGVMGCFDGVGGSTGEVAKWLDAPVVLVVDAGAQSRSAAATVLGFERFDPHVNLAGVIFNRVGGDLHARWLADAARATCRARVLGALRSDE